MTIPTKLVPHLREDARKSLVAISRETGIPQSTIYDWLRREKRKLIKKHTTLVDFAKLGYSTRANIVMKTEKEWREKLHQFITKHQNVNSAFRINHGYDLMAECIFRNVKELEDFLGELKAAVPLRKIRVHHIIEELKEEGFLSGKNPGRQ